MESATSTPATTTTIRGLPRPLARGREAYTDQLDVEPVKDTYALAQEGHAGQLGAKLADRLHNMRALEHLSKEKRRRIALETREIYAPLAYRLGMAQVKWELEDLAFKFIETDAYRDLQKKIQQRRKERERQILEMQFPLQEALEQAGIPA